MLRVALTGGIATGKSYCLRHFAELGVPTVDADRLARQAVQPGSPGLRAVVERVGADVLMADGAPDRGARARIALEDSRERAAPPPTGPPGVDRHSREGFTNLPAAPRAAP